MMAILSSHQETKYLLNLTATEMRQEMFFHMHIEEYKIVIIKEI